MRPQPVELRQEAIHLEMVLRLLRLQIFSPELEQRRLWVLVMPLAQEMELQWKLSFVLVLLLPWARQQAWPQGLEHGMVLRVSQQQVSASSPEGPIPRDQDTQMPRLLL